MALVSGGRSKLNPDAPIFIPAAFRHVEDFSPEWWELVKTSTWFRDYWLDQHQEESFDSNGDDDVVNLLPESFDLGIGEDDFPNLEAQLDELVQSSEAEEVMKKERHPNGLEMEEAEALKKNLSLLKSPKEMSPRHSMETAKFREKPVQYVSPKCSPRRIHQPR